MSRFISCHFNFVENRSWHQNNKVKKKEAEEMACRFGLTFSFFFRSPVKKKFRSTRCWFYLPSWRPHFIFPVFTRPTVLGNDSFFPFIFLLFFLPLFFYFLLGFLYRSRIVLVFEDLVFRCVFNSAWITSRATSQLERAWKDYLDVDDNDDKVEKHERSF